MNPLHVGTSIHSAAIGSAHRRAQHGPSLPLWWPCGHLVEVCVVSCAAIGDIYMLGHTLVSDDIVILALLPDQVHQANIPHAAWPSWQLSVACHSHVIVMSSFQSVMAAQEPGLMYKWTGIWDMR